MPAPALASRHHLSLCSIFLLYINRLLRAPARASFGISWWHFVPFLLQAAVYLPPDLMDKQEFISGGQPGFQALLCLVGRAEPRI